MLSCCREVARRSVSFDVLLNHSRSLSIVRNYIVMYAVCKFLLVFHCHCVSVLYRVWDIQRRLIWCPWNLGYGHAISRKTALLDRFHTRFYWCSTVTAALSCIISKIKRGICRISRFLDLHSTPSLGWFPLNYCHSLWYGGWRGFWTVNNFENTSPIAIQFTKVTDGPVAVIGPGRGRGLGPFTFCLPPIFSSTTYYWSAQSALGGPAPSECFGYNRHWDGHIAHVAMHSVTRKISCVSADQCMLSCVCSGVSVYVMYSKLLPTLLLLWIFAIKANVKCKCKCQFL